MNEKDNLLACFPSNITQRLSCDEEGTIWRSPKSGYASISAKCLCEVLKDGQVELECF